MKLAALTSQLPYRGSIDTLDPAAFDYPPLTLVATEARRGRPCAWTVTFPGARAEQLLADGWSSEQTVDRIRTAVEEFNADPRAGWAHLARTRIAQNRQELDRLEEAVVRVRTANAALNRVIDQA